MDTLGWNKIGIPYFIKVYGNTIKYWTIHSRFVLFSISKLTQNLIKSQKYLIPTQVCIHWVNAFLWNGTFHEAFRVWTDHYKSRMSNVGRGEAEAYIAHPRLVMRYYNGMTEGVFCKYTWSLPVVITLLLDLWKFKQLSLKKPEQMLS